MIKALGERNLRSLPLIEVVDGEDVGYVALITAALSS